MYTWTCTCIKENAALVTEG